MCMEHLQQQGRPHTHTQTHAYVVVWYTAVYMYSIYIMCSLATSIHIGHNVMFSIGSICSVHVQYL